MRISQKPLAFGIHVALLGVVSLNAQAVPDTGLAYHSIAPCRILETRTVYGGTGPIQKGVATPLQATGTDFSSQHGDISCNIPTDAVALQVSVLALNTQFEGSVIAWPVDGARPSSSLGVFNPSAANVPPNTLLPGEVLFNGLSGIVPICTGACSGGKQLNILLSHSSADVVIDVFGYFAQGSAGPTGAMGATGETGAAGPTGADGAIGVTGMTGAPGAQGVTGADGIPGLDGPTGADGATGATGADGNTILNGTTAPDGASGAQGDFYLDTTTWVLYGPKGATGWAPTGQAVTGPTGAMGATGATGVTGAAGVTGTTGVTGATGNAGATGATGVAGATGIAGATGFGATGPAGATGVGTPGAQGVTGATGATGATGRSGATGSTGAASTVPGPAGPTGVTGPTGAAASVVIPFSINGHSISSSAIVYYAPGSSAQAAAPLNSTAVTLAVSACTAHMQVYHYGDTATTYTLFPVTASPSSSTWTTGAALATCTVTAASGGASTTCPEATASITAGTLLTIQSPKQTSFSGNVVAFSCR